MKIDGDGVFFTQLSKYDVIDVNKKKLGHIGDLLLNKKDWTLNSFIIHGSFIEEKLESLKLKDDVDPIIPADYLDMAEKTDKIIKITKPEHRLAKTFTGWKPDENVHQFSKIRKSKVLDENNEDVGHVIDILFHGDGSKTLVISGSSIAHLFDPFHVIHHKEILVPIKFVMNINLKQINLSVSKDELNKLEHVSLYKLVNKDLRTLSKGYSDLSSRFYYLVYESDLKTVQRNLEKRDNKISAIMKDLSIIEYNSNDSKLTKDFVKIFNDVALTSVDPYEEMTEKTVQQHFGFGSFIAYRYGKSVGYVILSFKDSESGKKAAIAGIGVHHNARGKGLSTAFMSYIVKWLIEKDDYIALQADILPSNKASIGLFSNLGFKKVDEFYLC